VRVDETEEALAIARARLWLRSGRARQIRERARLSQADAARAVGTSMWQVSRWESGKGTPRRDTALRLAVLLDGLEEVIRAEDGGG
jgi:DNA-binding transcriptional regulator YiaG